MPATTITTSPSATNDVATHTQLVTLTLELTSHEISALCRRSDAHGGNISIAAELLLAEALRRNIPA